MRDAGCAIKRGCGLRGEVSPQIRGRPQMGLGRGSRGGAEVLAHGQGGKVMKKARITACLRLFPLSPLILRGGGVGRNFGFAIVDLGLEAAAGDKVNLELRTRSQGQSNLVKPGQT